MSLVAYAASSDEDSDDEEINKLEMQTTKKTIETTMEELATNNGRNNNKTLHLPQPKANIVEITENAELNLNLPQPKKIFNSIIEEKDDEFLHKKVAPTLIEKPVPLKRSLNNKQPVRITIPSLAEFEDSSDDRGKMVKVAANPSKSNSLLGMLPPPKFAAVLGKSEMNASPNEPFKKSTTITKTTSLVPHSVANKLKLNASKPKPNANVTNSSALDLSYNNSDESDDEDCGDFFSLNHEEKLPEVSQSEINAMVTKKAAQMAKFSKNLNERIQITGADSRMQIDELESEQPSTSKLVQYRDEINIEALVGTRAAKRMKKEDIQFIDISQDEVKLNQEEWLRNQLTQETEFQPTGRLVGDGPGAGTKKKHQITYLAYQAKANEQELQAMWAANRHTRRQTQSKYGF